MKIWVFAVCHNEAPILPFWLRHYGAFADRMLIFDDGSDDFGMDIIRAQPKATLERWPHADGMDEENFLKFARNTYPIARGRADWVIWCDMDEFVYHPDWAGLLASRIVIDQPIIYSAGFNMTNLDFDGLPKDDGRQLWEMLPMGARAPVYSKQIMFRPEVDMQWIRGKQWVEGNYDPILRPPALVKLLHYRHLGPEYTRARNARNLDRCKDKGVAWTCAPEYTGEGSPEWAEHVLRKAAFNVIDAPLYD